MARMSPRLIRRLAGLALALALLLGGLPAARAQDARYFPETGHTLRGQFRSFWEQNGALATFGFPITEEYAGSNGRLVQWFERARFELAEGGGQSRVDLGMLGVEFTQGRIFPKVPPIENTADRRYFAETQHIVQYGFKTIWETKGQLRIFGLPISEEIDEVLEDGQWHTVQYFERARFEYWPERAPGDRVLISLLGRRLAPADRTAPVGSPGQPAPPAQPTPAPAPPALPPSVNARVTPDSGPQGTSFVFDGFGFEAGENVGVWLTAPDQSTFGANFQAVADAQGSIGYQQIGITSDSSFPTGIWSFVGQGVSSKRQAIGYFRITGPAAATPGDPARLSQVLHDQLSRQGNGFVIPVAGPAGVEFELYSSGYAAGEEVVGWVTGPDGKTTPVPAEDVFSDGSGNALVVVASDGLADGIYTAVAYGRSSNITNAASFKITRDFVAGPGTPRPANVGGEAAPQEGPPGTRFDVRGGGLAPNETAEVWITDPNGIYLLYPEPFGVDANGRVGINPTLYLQTDPQSPSGVWGIHFRGLSSRARVDIYVTVTGSTRGAGDSAALLRVVDRLVQQGALPAPRVWPTR
jgi:hypothetical protein